VDPLKVDSAQIQRHYTGNGTCKIPTPAVAAEMSTIQYHINCIHESPKQIKTILMTKMSPTHPLSVTLGKLDYCRNGTKR